MSQHRSFLSWKRETKDFEYDTYDRTHTQRFEGGHTMKASSAPEFLGKKEFGNPEEMLAAALSSCHMLTFLAICAKSRLIVDSYEDEAVATLEKNGEGIMAVTKITLHPKAKFSAPVDADKLKTLHEKAHKHCFIGNSLKSEFHLEIRN